PQARRALADRYGSLGVLGTDRANRARKRPAGHRLQPPGQCGGWGVRRDKLRTEIPPRRTPVLRDRSAEIRLTPASDVRVYRRPTTFVSDDLFPSVLRGRGLSSSSSSR